MIHLTELQTRILEALAHYRFLTASQFQCLGISKSLPVIWRNLRCLTSTPTPKRAWVGAIDFPAAMRIEHVERVHYLTERGAEFLAELAGVERSELAFEKVTSVYHRDYWHRKHTIDFRINLEVALADSPWEIERWDNYFEKTGANRSRNPGAAGLRAKTRIDCADGFYLIPDSNFIVRSRVHPDQKALFSFEMVNGRDIRRILAQVEKHVVALRDGAMAVAYGVPRNYRALFVFTYPMVMREVRESFGGLGKGSFEPWLLIGSLEELLANPLAAWSDGSQTHHHLIGATR